MPERRDVDEALLKRFKQQRSDNIPVSGPLLMVKAEECYVNHKVFNLYF
jgi:hypothetical protein